MAGRYRDLISLPANEKFRSAGIEVTSTWLTMQKKE